jgi:hypothetical protein
LTDIGALLWPFAAGHVAATFAAAALFTRRDP